MQGNIFLLILFVVYFLPTIVAAVRKTTIKSDVFLMNLLAGWTGIGWVVAMVMAFWKTQKKAY